MDVEAHWGDCEIAGLFDWTPCQNMLSGFDSNEDHILSATLTGVRF